MSPEAQTAGVATIMFFGALTRSTFGFGEALVAMPLLALVLNDMKVATALVAINSMFNSVVIMSNGADSTDWRGGWRLLVASLAGIPVGVILLTHAPQALVKFVLSVALICFALYNLYRPGAWRLAHDGWAFCFGFVGGILGGAFNTSGPAFVIFGSLRGWSPAQFRSTLQGVFLLNSTFVLIAHCAGKLWSSEVLHYLAWTLPLVLIAVPIGRRLNRSIHPEYFHRLLYLLLLLLAGMLLWSAWRVGS